ncbi:MAG TPA: ferritin-like protein [Urbifossiella sp.]|jgi:hypothetical protein|nr:ferritin-like protein [Urbifossiella sp.]
MSLRTIETVADLRAYLHTAIQLEHATLPPYLVALYSLRPGTNAAAYQQIRIVAIEEMLHLTLAANVLNAVGGTPDLTQPDFVPQYPTYLPNGETDFRVDVRAFSRETLENFLEIERPVPPAGHQHAAIAPGMRIFPALRAAVGIAAASALAVGPAASAGMLPTVKGEDGSDLHFCTIGEFYAEIIRRMTALEDEAKAKGRTIFEGDPKRQIGPEYYYSGGGKLLRVIDLDTAQKALQLIAEQGEGYEGGIFDGGGELSHYYRFQQLKLSRSYIPGNEPNEPTGEQLVVDWDGVYPVTTNARITDYPKGSELYDAVMDFRKSYQDFLNMVSRALSGQPDLLLAAVGDMFRLKEKFYHLMHNPMPGQAGVNAAPVFGPI